MEKKMGKYKARKSSHNRLELEQGMTYINNAFVCNTESKKLCRGCELRQLSENCQYRYYPRESSKSFRYRMYNEHGRKIKEPICKHPDTAYKPKPKPTIWDFIPSETL